MVWDTVRSDRLSLYGHPTPTTPSLDAWARQGRVFENSIAAASTTVPGHASIFTGLLPSEHGANGSTRWLSDDLPTLAEVLGESGYRSFLYSENPHVGREFNLAQGFDVVEHPWSDRWRASAIAVTLRRLGLDDEAARAATSAMSGDRAGDAWNFRAAGELAAEALLGWLETGERDRPFFAVLNYMAAHYPLLPSRSDRARVMSPEQVAASYRLDQRRLTHWAFTLDRHELDEEELALLRLTYDAAVVELDGYFGSLIAELTARDLLADTVVVVTADHGEQLGEHHLLDHQFSVYEQVLRVPLVLYYPPQVAAGRESRWVSGIDLYPTLLRLAGVESPHRSHAVDLLRPLGNRRLIGEYPTPMLGALHTVGERFPDFDATRWERSLRAFYAPPWKVVLGSDGRAELFDLADDPREEHDLSGERPGVALRMAGELAKILEAQRPPPTGPGEGPDELSEATRRRLEALGYLDGE